MFELSSSLSLDSRPSLSFGASGNGLRHQHRIVTVGEGRVGTRLRAAAIDRRIHLAEQCPESVREAFDVATRVRHVSRCLGSRVAGVSIEDLVGAIAVTDGQLIRML
jgi:hypothetical protein